jgi:hypothetical protein
MSSAVTRHEFITCSAIIRTLTVLNLVVWSFAGKHITHNIYTMYFAGNEGTNDWGPAGETHHAFLLSHGAGNIRCSTVPENNTDMLALIDFMAVTKDPSGSLSSWDTSIHYTATGEVSHVSM